MIMLNYKRHTDAEEALALDAVEEPLAPLTAAERVQITQARERMAQGIYVSSDERTQYIKEFFIKEDKKYAGTMGQGGFTKS